MRLELKALAAAATAKDAKAAPDAAATAQLLAVLADPALTRENFDTLTEYAGPVAGFVTAPGIARAGTPGRLLVRCARATRGRCRACQRPIG